MRGAIMSWKNNGEAMVFLREKAEEYFIPGYLIDGVIEQLPDDGTYPTVIELVAAFLAKSMSIMTTNEIIESFRKRQVRAMKNLPDRELLEKIYEAVVIK